MNKEQLTKRKNIMATQIAGTPVAPTREYYDGAWTAVETPYSTKVRQHWDINQANCTIVRDDHKGNVVSVPYPGPVGITLTSNKDSNGAYTPGWFFYVA